MGEGGIRLPSDASGLRRDREGDDWREKGRRRAGGAGLRTGRKTDIQ